jgi:hypothetical protein
MNSTTGEGAGYYFVAALSGAARAITIANAVTKSGLLRYRIEAGRSGHHLVRGLMATRCLSGHLLSFRDRASSSYAPGKSGKLTRKSLFGSLWMIAI